MKVRLITVILLLAGSFGAANVSAACKPDFSAQDKISKEAVVKWFKNLTELGFLKSMLVTDIDLMAIIGRYGEMNALNIQIVNKENDRDRAVFDSRYRAVQGDRFVFGFKDGEPLTFVTTEVNNQAQIEQAKGLVMTVVLSAHLTGDELAKMRTTLTTKQIDAVRIGLASGVIERSIDDGNGKAMMEKFACFYAYLDSHGIKLSGTPQSQAGLPASVSSNDVSRNGAGSLEGKYVRKGNSSDFIDLGHGTFSALQDGHSLDGTYTVQGDMLTLSSPKMSAPAKGHFIGDTIKDEDGIVWEKQAVAAAASEGRVASQDNSAFAPGKYVNTRKDSNFFELGSDGMFSASLDGHNVTGSYKVQEDTITLTSSQASHAVKGRFKGNTMTLSNGAAFERQAEPQKPSVQLTIDQIIQMVAAKLPDDIIITTVRNSGSKFALTPETLIKLKGAGVSDAVIRAMTR